MERNSVQNLDAIVFMRQLLEELGTESVDMFLCDLPYTFNQKRRVTKNDWDNPIDDDESWERFHCE